MSRFTVSAVVCVLAITAIGCAAGEAETGGGSAPPGAGLGQARRQEMRHRATMHRARAIAHRRAHHRAVVALRRELRAEARHLLLVEREAEAAEPQEEAPVEESSECDPNYVGACLSPTASDYDCEGGSGNGPLYTGTVTVVGEDHYGLDSDADGTGCE